MVRGYRNRVFDPKLVKMGCEEIKAEGSEYDDMSRAGSRLGSRRGSVSEGMGRGEGGARVDGGAKGGGGGLLSPLSPVGKGAWGKEREGEKEKEGSVGP